MLLAFGPLERSRTARRRIRSIAVLLLLAVVQLGFSETAAYAAAEKPSTIGGPWSAVAISLLLIGIAVVISRARIKGAEREAARARELADHREYERNVAQQELLRRLEEERELAKEKMQFESQLTEYEKYASLAQLALGAAHEINNRSEEHTSELQSPCNLVYRLLLEKTKIYKL